LENEGAENADEGDQERAQEGLRRGFSREGKTPQKEKAKKRPQSTKKIKKTERLTSAQQSFTKKTDSGGEREHQERGEVGLKKKPLGAKTPIRGAVRPKRGFRRRRLRRKERQLDLGKKDWDYARGDQKG